MTLRRALFSVAGLALLLAAVAAAKIGPSNIVGMLRWDTRKEGALLVGSAAPDVALHALSGPGVERIAQRIGGKPLILIFGSFT